MNPTTAYRMCVRCIMDTSDPDIHFDAAGVCNHCHRYDDRFAAACCAARRGKLPQLVERIKAAGRGRDTTA